MIFLVRGKGSLLKMLLTVFLIITPPLIKPFAAIENLRTASTSESSKTFYIHNGTVICQILFFFARACRKLRYPQLCGKLACPAAGFHSRMSEPLCRECCYSHNYHNEMNKALSLAGQDLLPMSWRNWY